MSPRQPSGGGSFTERLLVAALCLVVAALLLQWAIQIVKDIAIPLALIVGVVLIVAGAARWLFRDRGPW